jgi:hypothetical protein
MPSAITLDSYSESLQPICATKPFVLPNDDNVDRIADFTFRGDVLDLPARGVADIRELTF